jgi:hypothetical protein
MRRCSMLGLRGRICGDECVGSGGGGGRDIGFLTRDLHRV